MQCRNLSRWKEWILHDYKHSRPKSENVHTRTWKMKWTSCFILDDVKTNMDVRSIHLLLLSYQWFTGCMPGFKLAQYIYDVCRGRETISVNTPSWKINTNIHVRLLHGKGIIFFLNDNLAQRGICMQGKCPRVSGFAARVRIHSEEISNPPAPPSSFP